MLLLATGLLAASLVQQDAPPRLDTAYEPNAAYPFGRPNPEAPAELAQFAFFIGDFACVDERTLPDGRSVRFATIWNGHYFLNGHAIQDQYWAPGYYTSNIRQFDEASGEWRVHFISEPGFSTGVWAGGIDGGDIVLTREISTPNGPVTSRLTFYEITDDGFRWRGQTVAGDGSVTTGWTSDCARVR